MLRTASVLMLLPLLACMTPKNREPLVQVEASVYAQEPKDPPEPDLRRSIEIRDVDPENILLAAQQFDGLVQAGANEIWFQINSYGGSIMVGLEFIQYVELIKKLHPDLKTICVVDVRAYSMGAVILESGVCDKRLMTRRSTLLFHNGSSRTQGTVREMENDVNYLRALNKAMAEMISSRLRMPAATYEANVDGKDWVLNWDDAILVRAIDGIIEPEEIPAVLF